MAVIEQITPYVNRLSSTTKAFASSSDPDALVSRRAYRRARDEKAAEAVKDKRLMEHVTGAAASLQGGAACAHEPAAAEAKAPPAHRPAARGRDGRGRGGDRRGSAATARRQTPDRLSSNSAPVAPISKQAEGQTPSSSSSAPPRPHSTRPAANAPGALGELLAGSRLEKIARAGRPEASESERQRRMRERMAGAPMRRGSANVWAAVGLVRGGAGTALVGSHEEVADRIAEYHEHGFDEFILSGYPHLEEAYRVGEGARARAAAGARGGAGRRVSGFHPRVARRAAGARAHSLHAAQRKPSLFRDELEQALRAHNRLPLRSEKHQHYQDLFVDRQQLVMLESPDWQVLYGRRGTGKSFLFGMLHEQAASDLDRLRVLSVLVSAQDCKVEPTGTRSTGGGAPWATSRPSSRRWSAS